MGILSKRTYVRVEGLWASAVVKNQLPNIKGIAATCRISWRAARSAVERLYSGLPARPAGTKGRLYSNRQLDVQAVLAQLFETHDTLYDEEAHALLLHHLPGRRISLAAVKRGIKLLKLTRKKVRRPRRGPLVRCLHAMASACGLAVIPMPILMLSPLLHLVCAEVVQAEAGGPSPAETVQGDVQTLLQALADRVPRRDR